MYVLKNEAYTLYKQKDCVFIVMCYIFLKNEAYALKEQAGHRVFVKNRSPV
jgi:hypothetical protein